MSTPIKPNRLVYVKSYKDRHGRLRHYYRRPGYPSVPLTGALGTEAFRASYDAAERLLLRGDGAPLPRRGFIYAVRVRGFDLVKIGFSTAPARRLVQLEAGSGMAGGMEMLLRFAGTPAVEQRLHRRFADQRLFGEWFRLSGVVADWLASIEAEDNAA